MRGGGNYATVEVEKILSIVPQLVGIPLYAYLVCYDKDADVLYLNFKKPSHADDSELTEDDIIIRYEKGEVVGITILNASKRKITA